MEHEHSPCKQLIELTAKLPEYIKRLEKLEDRVDKHDKDLKELSEAQAETKIYVKQILEKINGLESKLDNRENDLLKYLQQLTKDVTEERKEDRKEDTKEREMYSKERLFESKERTTVMQAWQSWGKTIVSMTVGALIAGIVVYIKLKAGGK